MREPKWLTEQMVLAFHDEGVAMFGGTLGLRDRGLLVSALNPPKNTFAYGDQASLFDLAAALCHGVAMDHPFLDGNKRTALLAGRAFLFLNGRTFEPIEADEVNVMVGVANGSVDATQLAAWFKEFSTGGT